MNLYEASRSIFTCLANIKTAKASASVGTTIFLVYFRRASSLSSMIITRPPLLGRYIFFCVGYSRYTRVPMLAVMRDELLRYTLISVLAYRFSKSAYFHVVRTQVGLAINELLRPLQIYLATSSIDSWSAPEDALLQTLAFGALFYAMSYALRTTEYRRKQASQKLYGGINPTEPKTNFN